MLLTNQFYDCIVKTSKTNNRMNMRIKTISTLIVAATMLLSFQANALDKDTKKSTGTLSLSTTLNGSPAFEQVNCVIVRLTSSRQIVKNTFRHSLSTQLEPDRYRVTVSRDCDGKKDCSTKNVEQTFTITANTTETVVLGLD